MNPDLHDVLSMYAADFNGIHPACEAVPMCSEDEFGALVADIKANGLAEPLRRTKAGRLLVDGRTRLLACYEAQQEIRIRDIDDECDVWSLVNSLNIERRHLTVGQKALYAERWRESERAKAKERQAATQFGSNRSVQATLPEPNLQATLPGGSAQSRDIIGAKVGVGGKAIDKAGYIREHAPDLIPDIEQGEPLERVYREAKTRQRAAESHPIEAVAEDAKTAVETVAVITHDGRSTSLPKPANVRFNRTNDAVDWASWTWNPVTGCEHGCEFCYAREIAHASKMRPYYPYEFTPTFHAYRLTAPANTPVPDTDDERDGRVFVCSMADLFGKWVPDAWIQEVFEACLAAPDWEYLFLTKWPKRYSQLPLLDAAWYGASVIRQADVKRVEQAMKAFDAQDNVKWISLEPMLEPIRFNDLSWCDLLVIGSQTSTQQPSGFVPEFAPEFDWIVDVVNQCRDAGVPYYLKANLGLSRPGMSLPKPGPRAI